jgi:hypothetical protein
VLLKQAKRLTVENFEEINRGVVADAPCKALLLNIRISNYILAAMSSFTQNLQYDREDVEFSKSEPSESVDFPGSGLHSRAATAFPAGLPEELDSQLSRLEQVFTVSTGKLKDIFEHFGQALEVGEILTCLTRSGH